MMIYMMTKFDVVTHTRKVLIFGVSHATPHGGGVLALHNFWDSFLFVHTTFVAELPNLTW